MSTRDISKAIQTATSALEVGNVATARRAIGYAAKRFGLTTVNGKRASLEMTIVDLGIVSRLLTAKIDEEAYLRRLFARNGTLA